MSQAFNAGAADTLPSDPFCHEYMYEDSIWIQVCDLLL